MSMIFYTLMVLAMIAVLASLFMGLWAMSKDGAEARKKSNKFMQYRVYLQAAALALFALAVIASRQ